MQLGACKQVEMSNDSTKRGSCGASCLRWSELGLDGCLVSLWWDSASWTKATAHAEMGDPLKFHIALGVCGELCRYWDRLGR